MGFKYNFSSKTNDIEVNEKGELSDKC